MPYIRSKDAKKKKKNNIRVPARFTKKERVLYRRRMAVYIFRKKMLHELRGAMRRRNKRSIVEISDVDRKNIRDKLFEIYKNNLTSG